MLTSMLAAVSDATQQDSTAQILQLQTQIQVMEQYQDRLLSTVHWSLGILAGIAALLTSFSWYVNFKLYDRDKLAIQTELLTEIDKSKGQLHQEITDKLESSSREVSTLFDEGVDSRIEMQTSQLKGTMTALRNRSYELEYEIIELKLIGIRPLGIKFRLYWKLIDLARKVDGDDSWRIPRVLGDMLKAVEQHKPGSFAGINAGEFSRHNKRLDEYDKDHGEIVREIKLLLNEKWDK